MGVVGNPVRRYSEVGDRDYCNGVRCCVLLSGGLSPCRYPAGCERNSLVQFTEWPFFLIGCEAIFGNDRDGQPLLGIGS